MNYGLPYKGSKNKLAERIVALLPERKHLIDIFCGGCAVSHAALVKGKYEHVHINDLNWMCPTLFMDALAGKYDDERRWISREDFERLKDKDPYVAVVWSFGNNLRDYMYSREIEPLKRAIHYAIFFSDYEPGRELGHDLSFIDGAEEVDARYAMARKYFKQFDGGQMFLSANIPTRRSTSDDTTEQYSTRGGQQISRTSAEQRVRVPNYDLQSLAQTNRVASIQKISLQLEIGNRLCRLHSLATSGTVARRGTDTGEGCGLPITSSVLDYAEVEIPEDSVIYCDIPYENTKTYVGAEHFDYERFYDWACSQSQPVFISSYDLPRDRFECVVEYEHRSILSQAANNKVTERIFIPIGQKERGNTPSRQLTLFDDAEF